MMINFIQRVTFAVFIAGACVSTIAASELEPANSLDNKGKQVGSARMTYLLFAPEPLKESAGRLK